MAYLSQLAYLPGDTRGGHESFDWVPQVEGVGAAGYPVLTTMDEIFELAWRVKSLQIAASARWTVGVDNWPGGMDVSGSVSSILPEVAGVATEINRFQSGIANPDWATVQGTSFLEHPDEGLLEGISSAGISWSDTIDTLRRLENYPALVRGRVWLPVLSMGMSAADLSSDSSAVSIASSSDVNNVRMATARYVSSLYPKALPLYQSNGFPASWTLTSCTMRVTAVEFWTYEAQPGFPIYSASSGFRLMSPFQSQR